ncbi:uncharacterized protein MONOS_18595 [Monocercomonoides exilis]|uniref:uncharacterized protein n=1 Tax=Monocercomonoides exilis TaxID=2049356 RepID=UPI003559969B|nr:hypothetical protein MONOS_18595 [Monocercomonoides exilis]
MKTCEIERFDDLLSDLERRNEEEQKQIIEEMNKQIYAVILKNIYFPFTKEWFDKMDKMIEEKKLSMENAIEFLKFLGYGKELKCLTCCSFDESLLGKRMKEMMIDENERNKEEKLLTDLCECYISLGHDKPPDLLSIYVPCLLKAASKKEENEKAQKDVEISLLALSNLENYEMPKELYLNEIKEIIKYHQEHRNLTHLAYQTSWRLLVNRLWVDNYLEEVIVNELHFVREAAGEIEDLSKCVDWKKTPKEMSREEMKGMLIIGRWFNDIDSFFSSCNLWNEELTGLNRGLVQLSRASRDNHKDICNRCLYSFGEAGKKRNVKNNDLLKSGAIDAVLEELQQLTLNHDLVLDWLYFFLNISRRAKEEEEDEKDEAKRKATKRKIFEKMEEEGCEDIITSFYGNIIFFLFHYECGLSLNISDYFVNV